MKSTLRLVFSSLACLMLLMNVIAMFSSAYASDQRNMIDDESGETAQVFSLYEDVDLVSTLRFYTDDPNINVKAVFPQLESDRDNDHDSEGIDGFNEAVDNAITEIRADFKNRVKVVHDSLTHPTTKKNNLTIDYNSSVIPSAQKNHIISIRFSIEGDIAGMAHPFHEHRVLNYDLDNDQPLTLADLFLPNADYLDAISRYCVKVLMRQLPKNYIDKEMVTNGTTRQDESFKNWNVKPNGLLITFDETTVAPYAAGMQTVLIPYAALKKIIAPLGPIGICSLHQRKCKNNNVLTGGFIDQALNTHHSVFNPVFSKV